MKRILIGSICIYALLSCSKKEAVNKENEEVYTKAPYDTTAVDSFSQGAISVDVAANIRRSSKAYQDSLLQIKIKQEEERKKKEEEAKIEKAAKDALEKEAKKQVENTTSSPSSESNPTP